MKVAKPGSVDHHAGPFILIYIRFLNLCQVFYTFSLCSSHAMLRVVLVMSCPYGSAGTSLRINTKDNAFSKCTGSVQTVSKKFY